MYASEFLVCFNVATSFMAPHSCYQEYISSKSVQLLQTAFLHIDVTSRSVNPISGGTSCTYVNHSLHGSFSQTNHIQPVPL